MDPDLALLEAWRSGDKDAGNALFKRHLRRLYSFFSTKIDGPVEDLIQETFLGCVKGRDRFEGKSTFRTYLFAIARNVLYQQYAGRDRSPDFTTASAVDLGASPSAALAERGDRALLLGALRAIPLDFQVTLELAYWEGLKGEEIAEVLGVSPHTVRSRMSRGRTLVREQLEAMQQGTVAPGDSEIDFDRWVEGLAKG